MYTPSCFSGWCRSISRYLFQVDVIIFPAGRSTQSSNTAVLGLTSGQEVWVSCDDGHVFGAQGFRGTTFTGAFLYWKWLLLNCPMAPYLTTWRRISVNLELNENKPFGNFHFFHSMYVDHQVLAICLYIKECLKRGNEI